MENNTLKKEQIITKYNLKSNYSHIGQRREKSRSFKNNYSILYPIYNVLINNEAFEYALSPYNLKNMLNSKSCLYLNESNQNIYCDISKGRDLYNRVNTKTMEPKINKITDIRIKEKFYNLKDDDLLFAFRCVLQDALITFEGDYFDFIETYGCEANRESHLVYNQCKLTNEKLGLRESEIIAIIDNLQLLGIE